MGQELLPEPCPFCGGMAVAEQIEHRWAAGCADADCLGFQSIARFARKVEAITAWNQRAGTPPDGDVSGLPDIGTKPASGEGADERLKRAYQVQQAGVPNQTALVWRSDLLDMFHRYWRLEGLAAHRTPPDGEIGALVEDGEDFWPPNTPMHNLAVALARAHDANVTEREQGAENAYCAANGLAVPYWNALATAAIEAFAAHQEELRHALTRICDAYELVCADTGKVYHKSPSSVYAHCRALIARGDKPEVGL